MVQITINSEGQDSDGVNATNALKTTIQKQEIIFPTISPHQKELLRASKRNMPIDSNLVTFVDHVVSPEYFLDKYIADQSYYENFATTNFGKVVNYSVDLHPDKNITEEMLVAIHDIQIDALSPFFFEYEVNIEQDENSLLKQLHNTQKWLLKQNSEKIVVPVINMKITKEGLFLNKLIKIADEFKRINVIYQSPIKYQANWASLKAFLKNSKIWCHMDCLLNRYNAEKIAHRVRLYAIGISSVSLGFPFGGGEGSNKKSIYQFKSGTHTFEKVQPPHHPTFAEKEDRTWINSLNSEIDELKKMRDHVKKKTLYSNYIPSKSGSYLAFSKGI